MRILSGWFSSLLKTLRSNCREPWIGSHSERRAAPLALGVLLVPALFACSASAQQGPLVLERGKGVISLEPYAPNILRITMSTDKASATAAPGYGFVAQPSADGWTHEHNADGSDEYRSAAMVCAHRATGSTQGRVAAGYALDDLNSELREHYFGGGGGRGGPHNDDLQVTEADGKTLLHMRTWQMFPSRPDPAEPNAKEFRIGAILIHRPTSTTTAWASNRRAGWTCAIARSTAGTNIAPSAAKTCACRSWCRAAATGWCGQPSKTTIDLGFNQRNVWSSEVGDRVSYFVISGKTSDEIYEGYRLLTGATPMLPRTVYSYIQSKAIYPTQDQLLDVANEYRKKNLPSA